ncbi:unnamed protein product, partial [Menidia menidia]
ALSRGTDALRMLLSVLLLLLVSSTQATHFYGTVMTYYPKDNGNGTITVILRYKLSFHHCSGSYTWTCTSGFDCGVLTQSFLREVDRESNGEWCQREGLLLSSNDSSNAPFQMQLDGGNWIDNIVNGIQNWKAVTGVELRNRSDTGMANTSPQTTILPALRVPSNCQRDFDLLAFDPDGDVVKCRNGAGSECDPCTPPSVLSLTSSSCKLSFSPTNSSSEGPYAVQLMMEDFPRQSITLTQTNGEQVVKSTSDAISKIPIQFVVKVDPVAPSCTEGHFLPKFLAPTPANRAQLYIPVNQVLEIPIRAEAANSVISELLFSGPHNVNQNDLGSGNFSLTWTPSEQEDGQSHPICFVIQANSSSRLYHSELRCLIVTVGNFTYNYHISAYNNHLFTYNYHSSTYNNHCFTYNYHSSAYNYHSFTYNHHHLTNYYSSAYNNHCFNYNYHSSAYNYHISTYNYHISTCNFSSYPTHV